MAKKYGLSSLLKGWIQEYGFTPDQVERILPLFPKDSSINDFRKVYLDAMKNLVKKDHSSEKREMDLFVLRTFCNYFTSWLNRVANQLPSAA